MRGQPIHSSRPIWREQLRAPISWWLLGAGMVATIVWVVWVVEPGMGALATGAVAAVVVGAALRRWGSTIVAVYASPDGGELSAGRGRLPLSVVAHVTALDASELRRQAGVDADARAFLVLPPFLSTAVRIDLADPRDPTPYWLVATRRPRELATAIASCLPLADAREAVEAELPPGGTPRPEAVPD